MGVTGFDHVALPTAHPEELIAFYTALGFGTLNVEAWRAGERPTFSITFGDNKINIHTPGFDTWLRGPAALPGCGDLCFVWEGGLDDAVATLGRAGIEIICGPVDRFGGREGGTGRSVSVYVRDPDDNLVELMCYDAEPVGRIM